MNQLIQIPVKGVNVSLTFEQAETLLYKSQSAIDDHPQHKAIWKERLTNAKEQYDEAQVSYPDELFLLTL